MRPRERGKESGERFERERFERERFERERERERERDQLNKARYRNS
jgi:hypothetical protein